MLSMDGYGYMLHICIILDMYVLDMLFIVMEGINLLYTIHNHKGLVFSTAVMKSPMIVKLYEYCMHGVVTTFVILRSLEVPKKIFTLWVWFLKSIAS